ncbi:hypothetical protein D3C77_585710 [compost metagenome]
MRTLQQPDNAIRIPNSSVFRSRYNNSLIRSGYRIFETLLNTCRAIYYDVFVFFFKLQNNIFHLFCCNGILIFRLCSRQHIQFIKAFILHQGLIQTAATFGDID